jgi:hypothetical protein
VVEPVFPEASWKVNIKLPLLPNIRVRLHELLITVIGSDGDTSTAITFPLVGLFGE